MRADHNRRRVQAIFAGASLAVLALGLAGVPARAQSPQPGPEGAASPTPLASSATESNSVAISRAAQPGAASAGEIVVTGQRAAERAALETKRQALTIVDSLVANDVGKLPDQNIAEATRRLPGVSVANDQGEGRYIILRGLPYQYTNVTLNGLTAPAPEPDGRQVKLDDIPSAVVGGVDVYKSLTPDLEASAIGGDVDIHTLSAFDRTKPFLTARGAAGIYDQGDGHPVEADLAGGTRFGSDRQFGIVVAGNYSRRPIESQTLLSTTDGAGPTYLVVNGRMVPQYLDIRDYNLTRTRKGLVGNFDWRPSSNLKLNVRALYSAFSDAEIRDRFRFNFPAPNAAGTSAVYTNQTDSSGTVTAARGYRFVRNRAEDDHTLNLSTGGTYSFGGGGEVNANLGYARAVKKDPRRNEFTYQTGASAVSATYDLSDFLYQVTPSATAFNPSAYTANSYKFNHRFAAEDLYQGRVDVKIPVGIGDGSTVQVGGKYLDRHKTNNQDGSTYSISNSAATLTALGGGTLSSIYDQRYQFGPLVPYNSAVNYFNSNPALFTLNNATSVSDSLSQDYDVKERIWAGYAMATLKLDRLTVIPGVRVEHTRGDYAAKSITATSTVNDGFSNFANVEYTNVFPGINATFRPTPRFAIRGGVTTSLQRADYSQLAPYVTVDTTANTVTEGNPNLKPVKSFNADASVEYYLKPQGILSAAAFYKRLRDPIFQQGLVQSGTFAGLPLTNASIGLPLNADHAYVLGLELNAQIQLDFLPGFLSGFGVGANATIVKSKVFGLPNRADTVPLFNQSKLVGTAQLYYEKDRLSARVAYSYRSKYLANVGTSAAFDGYVRNYGQVDARVAFQLMKQATIFLEGANLNNAPFRQYFKQSGFPIENERYGYSVRGGVQLAF